MNKRIWQVLVLGIALLGGMTAWGSEGEVVAADTQAFPRIEIENQTPCFLFGGYQLSAGLRYEHFRFRLSTQNSGRANFETYGMDRRNDKFRRSYDNGSVGVLADYFFNDYVFATAALETHRWLLHNQDTGAEDHMRTFDAGLGLGVQYLFCRHLFVQFGGVVFFRSSQSMEIEGESYTIPSVDFSPGLRLGVRF